MTPERLYKKLSPRYGGTVWTCIVCVSLMLVTLVVILSAMVFAAEEGNSLVGVILALVTIGIFAGIIWGQRKTLRYEAWKRQKRQERLSALGESGLAAVCEELARTPVSYKTFVLLEQFLYIPSKGILLRYEDIAFWKTMRHSTNGIPDSVWVEISEADGFMEKVNVRQWRTYLKELDSFLEEMHRHGFGDQGPERTRSAPAGTQY
ncbi:MAG: hypothetical protein IJ055_00345 [Oscillospiraceae bacterium]|nr:hypothetical protein [Oscillospiraceae bacterium]